MKTKFKKLSVLLLTLPVFFIFQNFSTNPENQDCVTPSPAAAGSYTFLKDVTYTNKISDVTGDVQKFDFSRPKDSIKRPLVILIHGGGWYSGSKEVPMLVDAAKRFVSLGYAVANFNYPLVTKTSKPGVWVNQFPIPIQGLRCGLRYLNKNAASLNIDTTRVVTWGGSAGGNLSTLLAYSLPQNSAVLDSDECEHKSTPLIKMKAHMTYSGVYALRNSLAFDQPGAKRILGNSSCDPEASVESAACRSHRWQTAPLASPYNDILPTTPPTFAVHSINDGVVNYVQLKLLRNALIKNDVENETISLNAKTHVPDLFSTPEQNTTCRMMSFLERMTN